MDIDDGYFGNFELNNNDRLIASVVNLSAGGINVAIAQKDQEKIKTGDTIKLKNIVGSTNLAFLEDIHAEIRWIKPLELLGGYLSVGCLFLDIAEKVRQQMVQFVDGERLARGQYKDSPMD
jgi:c-di-GMP-binding flagellar brake protein YcgR